MSRKNARKGRQTARPFPSLSSPVSKGAVFYRPASPPASARRIDSPTPPPRRRPDSARSLLTSHHHPRLADPACIRGPRRRGSRRWGGERDPPRGASGRRRAVRSLPHPISFARSLVTVTLPGERRCRRRLLWPAATGEDDSRAPRGRRLPRLGTGRTGRKTLIWPWQVRFSSWPTRHGREWENGPAPCSGLRMAPLAKYPPTA